MAVPCRNGEGGHWLREFVILLVGVPGRRSGTGMGGCVASVFSEGRGRLCVIPIYNKAHNCVRKTSRKRFETLNTATSIYIQLAIHT